MEGHRSGRPRVPRGGRGGAGAAAKSRKLLREGRALDRGGQCDAPLRIERNDSNLVIALEGLHAGGEAVKNTMSKAVPCKATG